MLLVHAHACRLLEKLQHSEANWSVFGGSRELHLARKWSLRPLVAPLTRPCCHSEFGIGSSAAAGVSRMKEAVGGCLS